MQTLLASELNRRGYVALAMSDTSWTTLYRSFCAELGREVPYKVFKRVLLAEVMNMGANASLERKMGVRHVKH